MEGLTERLAKQKPALRWVLNKPNHRKCQVQVMLSVFTFCTAAISALSLSDLRKGRSVIRRKPFQFADHVAEIGPDFFTRLYHLNIHQFHQVLEKLKPVLQRTVQPFRYPASVVALDVKLCITLRILAGASYLDLGWPYGIGRSTTYKVFNDTLRALNSILPPISFPISEEECRNRGHQFQELRKSPIYGIVSALDGIAIAIRQPRLKDAPDPRKYYNRKGFYSVCVQAAVGADYKFLFVSARHAGATHDSTAFQDTLLYEILEKNQLPLWVRIAADDAYSNGGYILTPYSGANLSQEKDGFNFYLSSCRIIVEQAFGMLVSRFGIFWSPLRYNLAKCTLIIMVACKLHNFIIDNSDESRFNDLPLADENEVRGTPAVHIQNLLHTEQSTQRSRHRSRETSSVRDRMAHRLNVMGFIRPRCRRS